MCEQSGLSTNTGVVVEKIIVVCECGWESKPADQEAAWNEFYAHYDAQQDEQTRRNDHVAHKKK